MFCARHQVTVPGDRCPHCEYFRVFGPRPRPLTPAQLADLFDFESRRLIALRLAIDAPIAGAALLAIATAERDATVARIRGEWQSAA